MIALLWPLFRYSQSRDAYILRLVGNRVGPVIVRRWAKERPVGRTPG